MDKIVFSFLFAIYHLSALAQTLMFFRAILSWIPSLNESKFSYFLYQLTEPLVNPIRKLLSKTKLAYSMFDISFLITFLVLFLIEDLALVLLNSM